MADAVSNTPKTQILEAPQIIPPSDNAKPSKFFSDFLYKASLVTFLLVLLPLFPSLAPEFINQTLHARSWELLQLICVGITVSYGLFSKKTDEAKKDHSSKIENAQSYVSKLLQVSSVFDDESENSSVIEENKFQTLNSHQYYRGEPVVVVAKESPVVQQENGVVLEITQKPLLLPVRSLKQRVPSPNEVDLTDYESNIEKFVSRSSLKRLLSKNSRNKDPGGLNVQKIEEKLDENVVFRSPIPWRSRSGRMEIKENGDAPPSFTFSSSMEEQELNSVESISFRLSVPNSSPKNSSPSTRKLYPSASFSSESLPKSSEDVVRKKVLTSPPPPPPPPPQFLRKSVLIKSNSNMVNNADSPEKVLRRSARSLLESGMEVVSRRMISGSELRTGIQNVGGNKSVRTFRPSELGISGEKESMDYETMFVDKKGGNEAMQSYVKFPEEEKKNELLIEKVLVESTDEEEEEEDSEYDDYNIDSEAGRNNYNINNDVGPDVDKKADEFIAKFREQIRLQRIESIRRSTAQRRGRN